MKNLICLILALSLLLTALGGCSNPAESEGTSTTSESSAESESTSESEENSSNVESSPVPFCLAAGNEYVKLDYESGFVSAVNSERYITAFCYDGWLRVYSLENGGVLYSKDYSSLGTLMRMETYSGKDGFDFRLCFGDRVIYLCFNDFSKSEEVFLPYNISFDIRSVRSSNGYYDINESSFVYSKEDGIALKTFGSPEVTIAENKTFPTVNDFLSKTNIESFFGGNDYFASDTGPLYFDDPRFICGGAKIVISAFSDLFGDYVGCLVYNIKENYFENYIFCPMPLRPVYPIEDRYICIPGRNLNDALNNTAEDFHTGADGYESYDYKTFVTYNFEMDQNDGSFKNFESFTLDIDTGAKNDFFSLKPGCGLYISGITENYFIVKIYSQHEENVYAIKYTD